MTETTTDAFLGGRLQVQQPKHGYRAGADPVFLAAAVPVKSGETVLELGCGVGTAMLCLWAREPSADLIGVEIQPDLARLALENLQTNEMIGSVVVADLNDLPQDLRDRSFDHVMMNPPFFDRSAGNAAVVPGRETGRGLTEKLSTWLGIGLKRLKPGGTLCMINRIESLPDAVSALGKGTSDITVLPLAARGGRPSKSFILLAKKGGKAGFRLLAPLVLHRGETHERDGESYTDFVQNVLRHGAEINLSR